MEQEDAEDDDVFETHPLPHFISKHPSCKKGWGGGGRGGGLGMVLRVRIAIRVILEVGLGWCEKWEEGEDHNGNRVSH